MTENRYLIFPAEMSTSLNFFFQFCDGDFDIGASSVEDCAVSILYKNWINLPYVNHTDFESKFLNAIRTHQITRVFTPHGGIWQRLNHIIKLQKINLELINPNPVVSEQRQYKLLLQYTEKIFQLTYQQVPRYEMKVSSFELAALIKRVCHIDGEMDDRKLATFALIIANMPNGDIVEIGSLYGKSAIVMASIANKFSNRSLLFIDPWVDYSTNQQETAELNKDIAKYRDFNLVFTGFVMNVCASGCRNIGYLRATSSSARQDYNADLVVSQELLAATRYCGKIALLHIDGNHDYVYVKEDIALWSDLIVDGGWLVIDDYIWAFANGPRDAADEFLRINSDRVMDQFISGGAIFIRIKSVANT